MLGKILKYDLKATARLMVPACLIFIVISIVNKLCLEIGLGNDYNSLLLRMTQFFTFTLYFLSAVTISIVTTVFVVIHFYKTMAGEQGYLTHTLPAQTETLVISKLICALIWKLIIAILITSSIFFMLFGHIAEISSYLSEDLSFMWRGFQEIYNVDVNIYSILFTISSVVGAIMSLVTYFACIALGNLSNKHKVMSAVFSYIGFYVVLRIVRLIIDIIFNGLNTDIAKEAIFQMGSGKMIFDIMFNIIISAILYLVTVYIFKRKLNLE